MIYGIYVYKRISSNFGIYSNKLVNYIALYIYKDTDTFRVKSKYFKKMGNDKLLDHKMEAHFLGADSDFINEILRRDFKGIC